MPELPEVEATGGWRSVRSGGGSRRVVAPDAWYLKRGLTRARCGRR